MGKVIPRRKNQFSRTNMPRIKHAQNQHLMTAQTPFSNLFLNSRVINLELRFEAFRDLIFVALLFATSVHAQSTGSGTLADKSPTPLVQSSRMPPWRFSNPAARPTRPSRVTMAATKLAISARQLHRHRQCPGIHVFVQNDVQVNAGKVSQFNISLEIQVEQQKVNVQEEAPQVQVNPENNASAVMLTRQRSRSTARRSRRTAIGSRSARRAFGRA